MGILRVIRVQSGGEGRLIWRKDLPAIRQKATIEDKGELLEEIGICGENEKYAVSTLPIIS